MIPRLPLPDSAKPECDRFLKALTKTPFSGEIRSDFASRLSLSTDNSIYQILPQSIVFPRVTEDLIYLFELADRSEFKSLSFSPRGGGTGTNGQSLSKGITIDCSKYMNQILEVNLEAGWVRVQPGVILDRLNAELKPHGVFFALDIAPSSRATIGGAINTDACGKGSRIYGKTSDRILELTWVLPDGTVGRSQPCNMTTLKQLKQQPDRLGEIYYQIDEIVSSKQQLIAETFPKMPRFMTGYNLAKVYSQNREYFDLNRMIAGSEGTLAIVTEAKLKLTPIPKYKSLLVLHYRCFNDALADAQSLLESNPAAIETIDEKILELAKGDEIYYAVKDFIGEAKAINLVEFTGTDRAEIEAKVDRISHQTAMATGYHIARDDLEITDLWKLRKKGVGLLGNRPGARKPIAFIEDTAVPPANLAPYIDRFQTLLARYQLDYAMFGHVDVGCIHVRPALDLKVPEDEALIRELSDRVVALVRQYGGVMWGEHGKGFRSEYTPLFFGDELYRDLRKIKAAFDPHNRLNPGKIVTPLGSKDEVVRLESPLRGQFDRQVPESVRSLYESAFNCNGNGACFNVDLDGVMCPSYKENRDRIHSPKGRASLLREWLRQLAISEVGEQPDGYLTRLWHTLGKFCGVGDYSHEVYRGMHGCLACKACATQCPIRVDIPALKSQFLDRYHTRYLRSPRDYLTGYIETLVQWQSRAPQLSNAIARHPLSQWAIDRFFGLVDPPEISIPSLPEALATRQVPPFDLDTLAAADTENSVILLQDVLTSFYEVQLFLDTYDLLCQLGYTVYVPPFFPNGKPLHLLGFLEPFQKIADRHGGLLQEWGRSNIPIVGIEPSITLSYRDEYAKMLPDPLPRVRLLQEFLAANRDRLPRTTADTSYYLLSHCTEKTLALGSDRLWQQVFEAMGLSLTLLEAGCCGMAGTYGHQTEHYAASRGIYQMSWAPHLQSIPNRERSVLVTGYSCRTQVDRFEEWKLCHPVRALLTAIEVKLGDSHS
ncbi:MAG: FAD-binding and (Fe-S)-binding domain-containing protein [Cyanobacteriota bacterium]|nr:FAD-binding and (Fe-S)-binding domain-containing protein [Cyanobacteriota bacterium]